MLVSADMWIGVHTWHRDQRMALRVPPLPLNALLFWERVSSWIRSLRFLSMLASNKPQHPLISVAFSSAVTDTQGTKHSFCMGAGTWTLLLMFVQQVLLIAEPSLQPTDIYHSLSFTGSFQLLLDTAHSPHIGFCGSCCVGFDGSPCSLRRLKLTMPPAIPSFAFKSYLLTYRPGCVLSIWDWITVQYICTCGFFSFLSPSPRSMTDSWSSFCISEHPLSEAFPGPGTLTPPPSTAIVRLLYCLHGSHSSFHSGWCRKLMFIE